MATTLPPHGEPARPFTRRQEQVLDLLAFGLSYTAIGARLNGISRRTVADRVNEIALLIPNDEGLEPEQLVRAYAGWRYWRCMHGLPTDPTVPR